MSNQTDHDSDFEVVVEQRAHKKGSETMKRSEHYKSWAKADAAWCAYRDLIGLAESGIVAADLIEHRHTKLHKRIRKDETISNTHNGLEVISL
jgi:hypothetical protein